MGIVAGNANPVFLRVFDGLAGMCSIVQVLNNVLMTAPALIRIEKIFQGLIDLSGIWMGFFCSGVWMAFLA